MVSLFPLIEYWWFYLAFVVFVLAVLAMDLGVFHKKAHEVSVREAGVWTAVWIGLAIVFNFAFYQYCLWKFSVDERLLAIPGFDPALAARQSALEFLTGFVVEKALAIDNIFVFAIIFSYFTIPKIYQHRILFFGILGALVFRAGFIAIGSYLMAYSAVVVVFGVFLIFTGLKMLWPSKEVNLDENILMKLLKKIFPIHTQLEGEKFFWRKEGKWFATPLLLALVFIEFSDIVFAVDSVPAIFALTDEPLIVFTSNIFAILGLRSLYFLLAGVMDKFTYIKYGLSGVLVFVGLKMTYLNSLFDGHFPILWSLGIIGGLIGGSILASVFKEAKAKARRHDLK